jgi:hypothetical protein
VGPEERRVLADRERAARAQAEAAVLEADRHAHLGDLIDARWDDSLTAAQDIDRLTRSLSMPRGDSSMLGAVSTRRNQSAVATLLGSSLAGNCSKGT